MLRGNYVHSNWTRLDDQPLTQQSLNDLLRNSIPSIRHAAFLSADECRQLVDIVHTHPIGSYDQEVVFPPIGSAGISQFEHQDDKATYFSKVPAALTLQERFKSEANIDVMARVAKILQQASGLPVRLACEGEKEYFAGLLRVVDEGIQIHADYAPYDAPGWEIGRISAQLTWNILLKQVPGGDTIIYDRAWQGQADDVVFKKTVPRYAYSPTGVEGRIFKCLKAVEGDLTLFNPRNFHEVKVPDRARGQQSPSLRYTMSSFVGLLHNSTLGMPELLLWS
ncbi:hypothetical protein MPH_08412 [Macrophomina phaseolina MS6]|uniref:Prolyl 4-hydroxylase alpha subunit Fe(2+) 2OG dioxygenase domain-containing protein n=1 Tax=Macrophomina phaseolina (strain MS6) TaxID=1126212 RepID=K2RIJ5_MACPH|nr:hypothetical protein MPH_08412 [Macrophomina phaseolina MS6]